jgi:hypothetical protein
MNSHPVHNPQPQEPLEGELLLRESKKITINHQEYIQLRWEANYCLHESEIAQTSGKDNQNGKGFVKLRCSVSAITHLANGEV